MTLGRDDWDPAPTLDDGIAGLRMRSWDFDPDVRDLLIAGATLPSA